MTDHSRNGNSFLNDKEKKMPSEEGRDYANEGARPKNRNIFQLNDNCKIDKSNIKPLRIKDQIKPLESESLEEGRDYASEGARPKDRNIRIVKLNDNLKLDPSNSSDKTSVDTQGGMGGGYTCLCSK